jgi:Tol biopolymer transport system component
MTVTPTPSTDDIIFVSDRSGRSRLYLVNAQGVGVRPFTRQVDSLETDPEWSPSGDKVVFRTGADATEIAVANADGTNVTTVADLNFPQVVSHPTWSPDGTRIAFLATPPSGAAPPMHLYVVDATGGQPRLVADNVSNSLGDGGRLTWSPDSSRLAFTLASGGIGVIGVDGTGFSPIIMDGNSFSPAWSPVDPDILAYLCLRAGQEVCAYRFSTGQFQELASVSAETGGIFEEGPAWTADGSHIAVHATISRTTNDSRLYRINPYTATSTVLAEFPSFRAVLNNGLNVHQSWSPDEQMITLAGADGNFNYEVYVVQVSTGDFINVTQDLSADRDPHWHPVTGATPTPSPTPTPTLSGHDARLTRIGGVPKNVRLSPGEVINDSANITVANQSAHTDTIGVYVDVSAPSGCTPNGRVLQTTVTLAAGAKTTLSVPVSYSCSDPAAANGLSFTWVAVADHGADDLASCPPGSLQGITCFNALANDDEDPADNRLSRNGPKVIAQ